ncbi:MAG: hypothetical protein ACK515_12025 [bacterium]|jgi:hypothetical protein
MAMQKPIEFPSGVVAEYHRILRANADFVSHPGKTLVTVEIGCYLNKEARDAGKQPVMTEMRTVLIEGQEPTREAVYGWLSQPVRKLQIMTPMPREGGIIENVLIEVEDPTSITGFNGADLV